jgi:hypothetical protein
LATYADSLAIKEKKTAGSLSFAKSAIEVNTKIRRYGSFWRLLQAW